MSSHHFVKEGQEPALFIRQPISYNQVQALLEWAPVVMVMDNVLDEVLAWGIKIDVVISKDDQLDLTQEKILSQARVKIIGYSNENKALSLAFDFLAINHQAVNIISGEEDYLFSFIENFNGDLKISLLSETTKWTFFSKQYRKWIAGESSLSFRTTHERQEISTHGLAVTIPGHYKSNQDGFVVVESKHPFWIGERYDN